MIRQPIQQPPVVGLLQRRHLRHQIRDLQIIQQLAGSTLPRPILNQHHPNLLLLMVRQLLLLLQRPHVNPSHLLLNHNRDSDLTQQILLLVGDD